MIVPLFPLRSVFLFPGAILPLQIFEPRYLEMVEDLLDTAGRLAIGTTIDDQDPGLSGSPPVHPVAGLGEISGHERLPDGRFLIALYGLGRIAIDEIESDHAYRLVAAEALEEIPLDAITEPRIRERLEQRLNSLGGEEREIPEEFPTDRLIDLMMMQSSAPPDEMARIYATPDLTERAEAVLALPGRAGPDQRS